MDRHSVDYYVESTSEALTNTEAFIRHVRDLHDPCVQPVITPRFIPTCSMALLEGLGALAAKYNVHVQSHISESVDQVVFTQSLHPHMPHDAAIYDACGLLTDKVVCGDVGVIWCNIMLFHVLLEHWELQRLKWQACTSWHTKTMYCRVLTLYPSYTQTVMAHGVFLGDDDGAKLFSKRGASVAHCPLSNVYFAEHMLRCVALYACVGEKNNASV